HGAYYRPGPVYTTIYPAAGGSVDWVYGQAGVMAYTYEVRDNGQTGFILPPAEILPTAEEIFASLLYNADFFSSPVRITIPAGVPVEIAPLAPVTIDISVTPLRDQVAIGSVQMSYRVTPQSAYNTQTLTPLGNNLYRATLPARACGTPTEMYFTAAGLGGLTVRNPFVGTPRSEYVLPVGATQTSFSDNFETNMGWTVTNVGTVTGAWTRGAPQQTIYNYTIAQPGNDN